MKKQSLFLISALALSLALSACGGGQSAEKTAETAKETAAEEKKEEKAEDSADTEKAAAENAEAGKAGEEKAGEAEKETPADVGRYVVYEYTAGGHTVTYDMLKDAGAENIYLELNADGTGTLDLLQNPTDITWEPGVVTIFGTSKYTYELDGDTLILNMQGPIYTMKREGGASGQTAGNNPAVKKDAAAETAAGEKAEEAETTAAAAETEAANASALTGPPPKGEVGKIAARGGDGIVSQEQVMRAYVYLSEINSANAFKMTYDELKDYFGVPGAFDKEEYSDHMKRYKCYFKWIAEEDKNVFLYVNFEEDDDGIYHISSYNSSGFTGAQAKDKYLAAMQEEAKEADKAQAANAPKKKHSLEVFKFGDHDNPLKIDVEIPQSGWSVSDKGSGIKLVDNEDPDAFGAGFIQFSTKDKVEDFDFYKDKFENYKELGTREIWGITFLARSYKNIGYDWIEYIAQIDDETALSVGIVRVDVDEGTTGDIILKSIAIK